jgi:membrane protease YdiL (CAAX protease family)
MNSRSLKVFIALLTILAAVNALLVFLPYGPFIPGADSSTLEVSKTLLALVTVLTVLVVYGGLGFVGFLTARFVGIPDIIDTRVSWKQRLLYPALTGSFVGFLLIVGDALFSKVNLIGKLIHPPFPTSLFASIAAGIGEEMLFRLFFISFFTWIFYSLVFKKKFLNATFWTVAIVSALLFSFGHYPLLMVIYGFNSLASIPFLLHVEIFLLNSLVAMVAAYYYKRAGFLAAVSVHLWTDIIWHVALGFFSA